MCAEYFELQSRNHKIVLKSSPGILPDCRVDEGSGEECTDADLDYLAKSLYWWQACSQHVENKRVWHFPELLLLLFLFFYFAYM